MKTSFPNAYVLSVMSDDHPGIVAAVGNAVERLGGNIDACSQTVLEGFFTLIMIVSLPRKIDCADLCREIAGPQRAKTGFQVQARVYEPEKSTKRQDVERFVITAFGRDKPGIVRRFSQYLAGKDINIVDLFGTRQEDQFVLIGQVEIPSRWEIALLQADLEQMGSEEHYTVKLQHEGVFVATNQLRLRRSS